MTVKELIEKLQKFDENKEVIIRFAVTNKDDIGYVLEPIIVDLYTNEVAIYSNYTATKEDCDFIGQKDLKELWEKRVSKMSEDELIDKHNKMVIDIINQCNYIIENRKYLTDVGIKNTVSKIIDIANYYYIKEPEWSE